MQNTNLVPNDQVVLKYTVKEKLKKIPKGDYSQILDNLKDALGISKAQLYRIISIESNSTRSATSDQLIIMAEFFSCTVDDLLTDRIAADGDEQ